MGTYDLVAAGATAALMVTGCSWGGDDLRLEGDHYQYVVSELRIPSNNLMARADGLDLNGDKTVDNQLGMVFGTLSGQGLGVGDTASEALQRGGLVMLADLQTTRFDTTELSGFTTYLGGDPTPAPCLDPARLETCGQHLLGEGSFSVDLGTGSDQAIGPIAGGVFLDLVGVMPVEIAIDPTAPLRLDLHGARVRLSQLSEGHVSGILGGGITQADLDRVVIPAAAAQIERIVSAECGQPAGVPPCGCLSGGRAKTLQSLFDDNDNCEIDVHEIATNSLVESLLSLDIRVDGQDLLSFGVGIELATATFAAP